MITLFISTYDALLTISLLKGGKELSTIRKESSKHHSEILVPTIEKVLIDNKLDVHDLNEILVINGPGSFTGVRLGITVAKTLSYTLNIPIKTITSIEALSLNINDDKKIITIPDNKGVYLGRFADNKLEELTYLKNDELDSFLNKYQEYKVYSDLNKLDVEKIYSYSQSIKSIPAHSVKAIYVKGIEALNGK